MTEFNIPVQPKRTIIKAVIVSVVVAITLLLTIILPAEYNIDPTGVGKALGLTKITQASASTSTEIVSRGKQNDALRSDVVTISIAAGKGLEYKLYMDKYAHLTYEWQTDGAALYFDFHGEPAGDTTGFFESYSITTANEMKGSLTTPFKGVHGWYWRNTSDQPIVVSLSMTGNYTIKG
ncbi:MAG: hypothetical protein ACPG52_06075 [Cognaticolwellia sp.]